MTEQPHKRPKTLSKRAGRTTIIVFFLFIAAATGFLTKGLGPIINNIKHDASSSLHFYKVTEVIAGDTLRVESNRDRTKKKLKRTGSFPWVTMEVVHQGSNEVIRVQGIMAPPLSHEPEAETFSKITGAPESELNFLADISRKALVILLHKQLVDLTVSKGQTATWNGQTVRVAQVQKSGVDVAYKQITGCQVLVTSHPHKYLAEYQDLEQKARDERLGIWKYLPKEE
jgi:endonuclease YncB( thermonuclease family)